MATLNGPSTLDLPVTLSTPRVLEAIRAALEAEVRPAVSSDGGIAALREIDTLLGYLAAREQPGQDIRDRAVTSGRALLTEGVCLMAEAGVDAWAGYEAATASPDRALRRERTSVTQATADDVEALLRALGRLTSALESIGPCSGRSSAQVDGLVRRLAAWESDWYESVGKLTNGGTGVSATATPTESGQLQGPAGAPASGEMSLAGLNVFLASALPGYPGGRALAVVAGSSGKRTYKLELERPWEGRKLLIVRQELPGFVASWVTADLRSEAMIVQVVGEAGVPVPRLLTIAAEPAGLGAPFAVLEECAGAALGSPYGDGEMSRASGEQAAALLAGVHRVPVTDLTAAGVPGFGPELTGLSRGDLNTVYLAELNRIWGTNAGRVASPTIERVLGWLGHNLVPDDRPCTLVHGDFGPHNLLAVDGNITALLDWEYAKPGDPAQDLGYAQEAVSRHLDWARFIDVYREAGGPEVSAASIQWTGVASWLRNAIVAMVRIASFNAGSRSDVATPGRIRTLPRILTKVSEQIDLPPPVQG